MLKKDRSLRTDLPPPLYKAPIFNMLMNGSPANTAYPLRTPKTVTSTYGI